MVNIIIWTIAVVTVLGLVLALVLYLVAQRFKVEEDPRIDEVEKVMPGANCGGCGFAGCRAFAEAAVKAPNLDNNYCPVGGNDVMAKVASILGYEVQAKAPQVAVVRCNGTCEARPKVNEYDGYASCYVKSLLYTGDTGCSFGCLGCGDCVNACQFGALSMDPATGLPVVDESKCTACGACVKACPKKVIELDYQIPVPACVQDAINEYRSQNDWFSHFLEDKCDAGSEYKESSSALYQAYRNYCMDTNEYVRSTADFYFALESAGFERVTLNRKRYFKGVRLRTDMDDAGDDFLT